MKWYVYLICFALMLCGVFCGIRLHTLMTAESYINGSINIQNQFSMESFSYASTSVEFYHDIYDDTNTYSYEIDLLRVDDFNGAKNKYQIVLNNYVLLDTQIMTGSVFSVVYMDFYDTNGEKISSAFLNLSIKFLSNKTTLTLSTTGGENASFLTQYFRDNGIRLKINELKGVN